MILYQVERWADFVVDGEKIFPEHYKELALDQSKIKLDVDYERYEKADADGNGLIVTARSDGKLIGYYIAMILPHLHYKSAGKMSYPDVYYILPEFRTGGVGAKLIMALEIALKAVGVVKIYQSCKVHQDHSALFEALGYKKSDIVLTKYIGEV